MKQGNCKNNRTEGNRKERERQQMAAMRLFDALSGVDESYLAACEEDAEKKASAPGSRERGQSPAWKMTRFGRRYGMVAAAVFCLALLGTGYCFRHPLVKTENVKEDFPGASADSGYVYERAINGDAELIYEAAGIVVQEETENTDGKACGDMNENGAECASAKKELSGGSTGDLNVNRGSQDSSQNSGQTDCVTESDDLPDKEEAVKAMPVGDPIVDMGQQGGAMTELTPEEARRIAVAGAYIPATWPADGRMESITGTDTAGSESICIAWIYANGWDSFFLSVRNLGRTIPQEIQEAVADVSRPETYDVRMYEIPYADSVPEEYCSTFLDPVFWREDFAKACVEARIKAYAGDSGDTDTPRGTFRVLYQSEEGDYVLVGFSGRGSAEEIWRMMSSIEQ